MTGCAAGGVGPWSPPCYLPGVWPRPRCPRCGSADVVTIWDWHPSVVWLRCVWCSLRFEHPRRRRPQADRAW